jgi:lipopolysaccharide export system protein LptA
MAASRFLKKLLIRRPTIASGLLACLLLFFCQIGLTQEQKAPINIEADRMESSQEENVVNFSGNVEARQNDFTILADRMTVHYAADAPSKESGIRAVQSIKAEGNVRMKRENWTASCDRMEYYEKDRKVVLLGNSKVWQNNNMVTGERVEVFLDEGRSVVERGKEKSERVKAFFYPESTETESAGKEDKDGAAPGR